MRVLIMVSIMALGAYGVATAQGLYDDPSRYLAVQQTLEMAQRDSLFRQQEAQAAQARADTEMRLSGLAEQRRSASAALYTGSLDNGAQIDAQLSADTTRMDQLTAAALARSNARILAVKPVTK